MSTAFLLTPNCPLLRFPRHVEDVCLPLRAPLQASAVVVTLSRGNSTIRSRSDNYGKVLF